MGVLFLCRCTSGCGGLIGLTLPSWGDWDWLVTHELYRNQDASHNSVPSLSSCRRPSIWPVRHLKLHLNTNRCYTQAALGSRSLWGLVNKTMTFVANVSRFDSNEDFRNCFCQWKCFPRWKDCLKRTAHCELKTDVIETVRRGKGCLLGLFFVGDRAATLHPEQGRLGFLFKPNQSIRCDDGCVHKDGVGHQGGICA